MVPNDTVYSCNTPISRDEGKNKSKEEKNSIQYFKVKKVVTPIIIKEIIKKDPFIKELAIEELNNIISDCMELYDSDENKEYAKIDSDENDEYVKDNYDKIDSDDSISIDSEEFNDDEIFGDECDLQPEELHLLNMINMMRKSRISKSEQRQIMRKKEEKDQNDKRKL